MLGMIWAQSRNGVIGRDGGLPWHLPEDLAHFRATTGTDAVIHGRSSWDALPPKFRPLPGRRNIVLTRNPGFTATGAEIATSLGQALQMLNGADAWVCGGGQVYAEAMSAADLLVVSQIDADIDGDTFAPQIGPEWGEPEAGPWIESTTGLRFRVLTYRRTATPKVAR
ncbi:MAG: dihydrofolate reductase [Beutenbergiaceae bacterium]